MTRKRLFAWCAALLVCFLAACSAEQPAGPAAAPTSAPKATPTGYGSPGTESSSAASTGAGSSGGGSDGGAESEVVDCAHDIGGRPPDDGYRVVLDAVALPTGMLEPQESGEPGHLFAKTGLLVRAGTAVELTVAPTAAARVTIGWGSPGPEGTTIRVPACPSANGWLAFAGGYTVTEPVCVPLIVRAGGREQRAEVSVGVRC